ncbi:ABC transporter permease [uncultured Sphaerochaeta sp.]|uniref:ABC transporter permease n=1 Tax=uncultured Sphaerochaeta sp. TaxID=886478 RepID=UPI0037493649
MSNKLFSIILWTILCFALVFLLAPLVLLLFEGWKGVPYALMEKEVQCALFLSLWTATVATIFCMGIAVFVGYALHGLARPLKKPLSIIFALPLSLPHLVSGVALLLLYGRKGLGDWLYTQFGIDFVFTKAGIVLALVFVNLSYAIVMMYSGYEEQSSHLEFTARTLGCSRFQSFCFVTFPLSRRILASTTIMTWSRALGEFGAVIMIAGTTRMKTEILPTTIFLNMSTGDLDIALGVSIILIIVSVVCITCLELLMPDDKEGGRC